MVTTATQGGDPAGDDFDRWPTGRLLSAAARRVEREWNVHLDVWGLTHASLPVLVLLEYGDRSQRELAAATDVTEQTMSRVLDRLERNGYIVRRPLPADRRRHAVTLTDAGRAVVAEAKDPRPAEEMTTRGLSPAEVVELRRMLEVVLLARTPEPPAAGADRTTPPTG